MRTRAESQEHYQLMKAAKVLADFARLEPEGVEGFRQRYPDFVPAVWWVKLNWLKERDLLNKAWRVGFPADLTLKLTTASLFGIAHILTSAGLPANTPNPVATTQMVTDALDSVDGRALFGLPPKPQLLAPDGTDITKQVKQRVENSPQVWLYQRAVLFLHIHPKQARICAECKKPFVSESSNAQRCLYVIDAEDSEDGLETTCVGVYRKHYKHELWDDGREQTNAERRAIYAAAKKKNQQAGKAKPRR